MMNLKAKIYMNEIWKPVIGHTDYFYKFWED